MAFCFSFGVDEKDSATVSGVRQPFPVFIDLSQNKAEKKERKKKKKTEGETTPKRSAPGYKTSVTNAKHGEPPEVPKTNRFPC